jgi:hypothetical protein
MWCVFNSTLTIVYPRSERQSAIAYIARVTIHHTVDVFTRERVLTHGDPRDVAVTRHQWPIVSRLPLSRAHPVSACTLLHQYSVTLHIPRDDIGQPNVRVTHGYQRYVIITVRIPCECRIIPSLRHPQRSGHHVTLGTLYLLLK